MIGQNLAVPLFSRRYKYNFQVFHQHKILYQVNISFTILAEAYMPFFSQNFYIIQFLKTTHPIEFSDSSN